MGIFNVKMANNYFNISIKTVEKIEFSEFVFIALLKNHSNIFLNAP